MAGVQRIATRQPRPAWQKLLVRTTWLGLGRWDLVRRRGRRRFTRDRVVLGLAVDILILVAHAFVASRPGVPLAELWAPAFAAWYVPIALAIPALLRVVAPLEWWICEARYREELARRGWKPALLPAA